MAAPMKSTAGRGYTINLNEPIEGFTRLHQASWLGNQDDVRNCLKTIQVNSKDDKKRTPLHLAAAAGHTSIALILMENDLNFNDRDVFGKTAIMKAVECSHKETARAMITKGADLTVTDFRGNTPMHVALREDHFDIAALMLQYFPNCNLTDADGIAPMHILAEGMQIKLARKFIDYGASVNAVDNRGRSPLMVATKRGCFPMVSMLLKHGSNPQQKDSNGWTARDYASIMGHTHITNVLEKHIRGDVDKEKESDSSLSSEEESTLKFKSMFNTVSQRVVPIRIESETMFQKRQNRIILDKEMAERLEVRRRGEGIRDVTGKLHPMPDVVASLYIQGNKLGDIHKWLLQHQEQLKEKEKDRDELKKHAKKLWEERKKLLPKLDSRKTKVKELKLQLENVPSIKESEALKEQVEILGEALSELKQEHRTVAVERDDLQSIFDGERKLHQNVNTELKEKVDQLTKKNETLYEELTKIQNQTRDITSDLNKKCNAADELVNNYKILLRGTFRLLDEKNSEVDRVMNEADAQQHLISKTKQNCNTVHEANVKVSKNIEEVDNRMKSVKKHIGKIHRELDSYSLTKSLVDAGVIETKKPTSEEPKRKMFACCRRKERPTSSGLHELKPEDEVSKFATKKYDAEAFMSVSTNAPTICETNLEQTRYSWIPDEDAQTSEMMAKEMEFLTAESDRETNTEDNPDKTTSNLTQESSDDTVPLHLQAKLAVVAAKYSK